MSISHSGLGKEDAYCVKLSRTSWNHIARVVYQSSIPSLSIGALASQYSFWISQSEGWSLSTPSKLGGRDLSNHTPVPGCATLSKDAWMNPKDPPNKRCLSCLKPWNLCNALTLASSKPRWDTMPNPNHLGYPPNSTELILPPLSTLPRCSWRWESQRRWTSQGMRWCHIDQRNLWSYQHVVLSWSCAWIRIARELIHLHSVHVDPQNIQVL